MLSTGNQNKSDRFQKGARRVRRGLVSGKSARICGGAAIIRCRLYIAFFVMAVFGHLIVGLFDVTVVQEVREISGSDPSREARDWLRKRITCTIMRGFATRQKYA